MISRTKEYNKTKPTVLYISLIFIQLNYFAFFFLCFVLFFYSLYILMSTFVGVFCIFRHTCSLLFKTTNWVFNLRKRRTVRLLLLRIKKKKQKNIFYICHFRAFYSWLFTDNYTTFSYYFTICICSSNIYKLLI